MGLIIRANKKSVVFCPVLKWLFVIGPLNQKNKNMKEFVFIVRLEELPEDKLSPAELEPMMRIWENWIDSIIAQNILVSRGNRLGRKGRTVKKSKVITNGPYAEIKEILTGVTIVKADTLAEATEIAKGCPIFNIGGSVEVRGIIVMNMDYNK